MWIKLTSAAVGRILCGDGGTDKDCGEGGEGNRDKHLRWGGGDERCSDRWEWGRFLTPYSSTTWIDHLIAFRSRTTMKTWRRWFLHWKTSRIAVRNWFTFISKFLIEISRKRRSECLLPVKICRWPWPLRITTAILLKLVEFSTIYLRQLRSCFYQRCLLAELRQKTTQIFTKFRERCMVLGPRKSPLHFDGINPGHVK